MTENTAPLAEIEIPERVTVQEQDMVAAKDVSKKDVIGGLTVSVKRTGPKWTVLETADGRRIVRVENDTLLPVTRTVETDESKAARHHALKCDRIVTAVNEWEPTVPAALAKINEHVAKGYVVGYSEMGTLATAQADDIVWARYCQSVRFQMTEKDEPVDAVAARDYFINHLRDQVVQKAQYANNRSSNGMSNLIDDENLAAAARFIERGSWGY